RVLPVAVPASSRRTTGFPPSARAVSTSRWTTSSVPLTNERLRPVRIPAPGVPLGPLVLRRARRSALGDEASDVVRVLEHTVDLRAHRGEILVGDVRVVGRLVELHRHADREARVALDGEIIDLRVVSLEITVADAGRR